MALITPALVQRDYEDRLMAAWSGGFSVLAFMFTFPDEPSIRTLDSRGDYFDLRTGETWDLFFPGYYRSDQQGLEIGVGSRRVGGLYANNWYFNPSDFDNMRRHVEAHTSWNFSGEADLVLINVWVPDHGRPTVDWESAQWGRVSADGDTSLQAVVERISLDFEKDLEDSSYGAGAVVSRAEAKKKDGTAKQIMIGAAAQILGAIGQSKLGFRDDRVNVCSANSQFVRCSPDVGSRAVRS